MVGTRLAERYRTGWRGFEGRAKPTYSHVYWHFGDSHAGPDAQGAEDVLKMAVRAVELAKSFCDSVEFSPMDVRAWTLAFSTT